MDPVSQGLVGATLAQSIVRREKLIPAGIAGVLSGMAADLDVIIRSSMDPLLFLEFHRQFTHSLIFIPVGAFIVSLTLFYFIKNYLSWKETYIVCFLGYATHALLDACTSYGTKLLWPFSSERIAWNNISIIDPLFTLPIIIFFACICIKKSRLFVFLSIGWALLYISIGLYQNQRALKLVQNLAISRGHFANSVSVKPSFGNLFLWKIIYEFENFYYVDALRLTHTTQVCAGTKVKKLNVTNDIKKLVLNSQQARDIDKFRDFSAGFLSYIPKKQLIIDVRYSYIPNEINPLWGIIVSNTNNEKKHVEWWESKAPKKAELKKFLSLLRGSGCQTI